MATRKHSEVRWILIVPTGLNVVQWVENMKSEHCDIDPNNPKSTGWGASDRRWKTGNYGLETRCGSSGSMSLPHFQREH